VSSSELPSTREIFELLERVQQKAIKMIKGDSSKERLRELGPLA